ncbi:hypothetical protein GCM10023187_54050 [Nibrella viscosa]|uniref:Transposase n=1 Tax=Nibrella viscosa TaxID=1084524 RepID=A0ABP8L0Z2_9BACT
MPTLATDQTQQLFSLIEAFPLSGLSLADFCQQAGISPAKFYYWQRKARQAAAPPPAFVALSLEPQPTALPLEVIYPNGVRIQLPGPQLSLLRSLVTLLDACSA